MEAAVATMKAAFYLLFISVSLISAQMPWEIPSLPEDSDEDINRGEFECFAKCFNVLPSAANTDNNNTITKMCERKVTGMRLLRVATTRMYISKTSRNWFQSYHFCRKFGMNLVPVLNPTVENAINRLIVKHAQGGEGFWVGATDMAQEGKFYWGFGGYDFDAKSIKIPTTGSGRCIELKIIDKADAEETEWARTDCAMPRRFICSFPSSCIVQNGTAT